MKLLLVLSLITLSSCRDAKKEASDKAELIKLGECVCSGKGGLSYAKTYVLGSWPTAAVQCATSTTEFEIRLGDYCKKQGE